MSKVVAVTGKGGTGKTMLAALMIRLLGREAGVKVLAIDAPLTLPACLRCQEATCPSPAKCDDPNAHGTDSPYTIRMTEEWIRRELGIRPMPTMVLGMITARGILIVRRLRGAGFKGEIIEVYPKATLYALARSRTYRGRKFDKAIRYYKSKRGDITDIRYLTVTLSSILDIGKWLEPCWEDHNRFDAVISGLTGYLHARDKTLAAVEPGHKEDGAIIIPDWKKV